MKKIVIYGICSFILSVIFNHTVFAGVTSWTKSTTPRWSDAEHEYFVGTGEESADEHSAQVSAVNNARLLLSNEILTLFYSELESTITEKTIETEVLTPLGKEKMKREEVIEESKARLKTQTGSLFENVVVLPELTGKKGFGNKRSFQYKALIKLSKEEYNELTTKPRREEVQKLTGISTRITGVRELLLENEIQTALEQVGTILDDFESIVFRTTQRTQVYTEINTLLNEISINLKAEVIGELNQTVDVKNGRLEGLMVQFSYNNKPAAYLKVAVKKGASQARVEFDEYTAQDGTITVTISDFKKIGKCGVLIGPAGDLARLDSFGGYLSWICAPVSQPVFSALVTHHIEYNDEHEPAANYLQQQISQFMHNKFDYEFNEYTGNDTLYAILDDNDFQDLGLHDFITLGDYSRARYLITGKAVCTVRDDGDGLYNGNATVYIAVFDALNKKIFGNQKFETSKKLVGKDKNVIAETAFKALRPKVIKWLDKKIMTKIEE